MQVLKLHPVNGPQDVDQRITRDVERLAGDMAALVPTMVKPVVDILWFSSQLWALTGRRGMAVLYIYAALGFGCLRCAQQRYHQHGLCSFLCKHKGSALLRLWETVSAGDGVQLYPLTAT